MQKIHFSIQINAPREKVWNTMLEKATYGEWTKAFNPGSTYDGNWEKGSTIKFIGTNDDGRVEGGMYSRIEENRLHEFVSIQHLGMIDKDGNIDITSDEVKKWTPAFENYSFADKDGGTELSVDMDVNGDYKASFEEMWPKALESLKQLAEK